MHSTQELNIFNQGQKMKEYQWKSLEYILRMPTYRTPWKLHDFHPKGRRESSRPPKRWKDQLVRPGDRKTSKYLNFVVDVDDHDDA
jgi:hypothetical protein